MPTQQLIDLIESLSPEQMSTVEQFIKYLKQEAPASKVSFRAALDFFVKEHPELLRRLSQ